MADSDEDSLAALKAARDEARATLDHQVSTSDDVDSKAMSLLQFDATLGMLAATALPAIDIFGLSNGALVNVYTTAGICALFLSAVVAGVVYTMGAQFGGIGAKPLDSAVRAQLPEKIFYRRLVRGYADWIRANRRRNAFRTPFLTMTLLLTVAGMLLVGLGLVYAAFGPVSLAAKAGAVSVYLAAVAGSRLDRQTERMIRFALGDETAAKHDDGFRGEQVSQSGDNREY